MVLWLLGHTLPCPKDRKQLPEDPGGPLGVRTAREVLRAP